MPLAQGPGAVKLSVERADWVSGDDPNGGGLFLEILAGPPGCAARAPPLPLRAPDDRATAPVLPRSAGVRFSRLPLPRGPAAGAGPAGADQRGPPDGVEHGVVGPEMGLAH